MLDWLAVPLFAALFFGMLVLAARLKKRFGWSGETSRKWIHATLGLATLGFPWLFSSPPAVWALAAASIGILIWARWRAVAAGDRGALHDVDRRSLGDLCYPLAIALTFQLAAGNLWLYLIPVLVLALADAAGAVVGVRYGTIAFRSADGRKSLEGSLSIGFIAFLSVHVPLLLSGTTGRLESVLIAAIIAILIVAVESIAIRGLDNIYIPLVVWLLLVELMRLDPIPLAWRLGLLLGLIALGFGLRSRSQLSGSASLGALLVLYLVAVSGGLLWLLPPVYVALIYGAVTLRTPETAGSHELPGILAVAGSGLAWMILGGLLERDTFWPFLTAFGIAAGHIHLAGVLLRPRRPSDAAAVAMAGLTGVLPVLLAGAVLVFRGLEQPNTAGAGAMLGLFFLMGLCVFGGARLLNDLQFRRFGHRNDGPRWLRQTAVNFALSFPVAVYALWILA